MAFDFPASPTNGQEYTSGGVTYVWNGVGWIVKPLLNPASYVLKAGDTMTGDLTITKTSPFFNLNKTATSGQRGAIFGQVNGSNRWRLDLGNGAAESAGNVGSDISLFPFDNSGNILTEALRVTRSNGQVTIYGNALANTVKPTASPNVAWGFDGTGQGPIPLAPNLTYDLAVGSGLVSFIDNNGATAGVVFFAFGMVSIIFNYGSTLSTTIDTANKLNIYYNSGTGKYRFQNKTTSTLSLYINMQLVRPVS